MQLHMQLRKGQICKTLMYRRYFTGCVYPVNIKSPSKIRPGKPFVGTLLNNVTSIEKGTYIEILEHDTMLGRIDFWVPSMRIYGVCFPFDINSTFKVCE